MSERERPWISGYEYSLACDGCDTVHNLYHRNTIEETKGVPITDGKELTCMKCGTKHTISIEVDND